MEACLLVDVGSAVPQLLPAQTSVHEVLEKGPFHTISLPSGWTLHWSSSSYQQSEVNSVATNLAKQLIKGDACLVHPNCQQHMLDELLQSRPWRMAQPCQPSTPRSSSSSQMQQQWAWADCSSPSSSSSSSHAALKRARSLQRIAAANSTRQRILSGMAAENSSPVLECTTPPQHHNTWYGNKVCGRGFGSKQQHGTAQASKAVLTGLPPVHTSSCTAAGGQPSAGSASACSPEHLTASCLPAQQQRQPHQLAYREVIPFHLHNSSSTPFNSSSSLHEPRAAAAVTGVSLASPSGSSCSQLCSHSFRSCSSNSSVPCGADGADSSSSGAAAACSSGQLQCSAQQAQQDVGTDAEMSEAEEQQQQEEADAAPVAAAPPAWTDLPEGLLGRVAGCLGSSVAAVTPMYAACRAWRRAVLDDDQLLLGLRFGLNVARPLKPAPAQHSYWHASARQQHPALLLRACKLGNVSALVARARLLDACGCAEEGMRCWKRAAKAGHVEGQLLYGLGLYRGIAGLQDDAHDAHSWLLRALKQVRKPEAATLNGAASSSPTAACSATPAAGAQPAATAAAAPATPTTTSTASADTSTTTTTSDNSSSSVACASELSALSQRVLAQAGLVLGYLAFDGEGSIKVDKTEATKYFRLAARAGSKEAEEVLGWVYNTGQYGAI